MTTHETYPDALPAPGTGRRQRWRSLSWKALPLGQSVSIVHNGRELGTGRVDGATPDGAVVWIHLDGVEGRRLFHRGDDVQIEAHVPAGGS